jgi:hypothetical protein
VTGFLRLFRHELTQRAFLFAASLAMGLFVLVLPLLPGTRVPDAELRGAAGLITVLSWCAVLAILLGGSIFTRDLAEGRLAFDFRLPVRPGAIWSARLLAAIVTVAVAGALLLTPPSLAGMDFASAAAGFDEMIGSGIGVSSRSAVAFGPAALLALLLLANMVAFATRSRQAWAAVDLFSIAIVGVATYSSLQLLRFWQAGAAIGWTTALLAGLTLLGAVVATHRQLTRGRTETDLAQRNLSLTFFAFTLIAAGAGVSFANLVVRPEISALQGENVRAEGLGPDWVSLLGRTKRNPSFLVRFLLHPASGKAVRLGPIPLQESTAGVQRSRDHSRIAWLESDASLDSTVRLKILDTGQATPSSEPTPIAWKLPLGGWALSPQGDATASLQYSGDGAGPRRVVVESISTGAIEASIPVPGCKFDGPLLFLNRQEVLVACGERRYWFDGGLWSGVVRVNLVNRSVSTFEPGMFLSPSVSLGGRPGGPASPQRPMHWSAAEEDEAFEGPAATNSIQITSDGKVMWFDPTSRKLQPLLKVDQYKSWQPGTSVNECRGLDCREAE